MLQLQHRALGLATLTLAWAVAPAAARAQDKPFTGTVKIGMVSTLFKDVSPAMVQIMMPPFQALMRAQTGLEGEVVTVGDAQDLGSRLHDGKVELGVFHGFEFAWAQDKYPDLRPLVIAVNHKRVLHAYVVVREDSTAADLADLKGQAVAVPRKSREHCMLFLDRACRQLKSEPKDFFGTLVAHGSTEEALDDLLRDKVQAALVDSVSLDTYEQLKPGCFARLKVLKQSEPFPSSVVAYRLGALDPVTLGKFRDGMINANQNPRGKELMTMWRLSAFENVPADYQQALSAILRAYPPPGGAGTQK
jgi:ABC-type phosphate/phosphonate transport system substrate-binding protein